MMNVDQITTRLSMMDDAALQKFAAMNKSDPYLLPLAISESNRRQRIRMAGQAQQAMPQPKVADAAVAQMQPAPMPPEQMEAGISQLPARNIETLADGGIAGFAEGKRVFSADKYLENPMVQRFLDYINMYEGSPKENQTVGYHKFDDLSQHPNKRVKFNKRGDKSTAAGAYQLINRTWQDQAKKQGLTDFSLENQKRAAVGVLKETGALDALMKGDIEKAKQRAARAWASIPGSTIGEATGQKAKFNPRAEQVLADIAPPTKVAETKKPVAPKREQTVGLSPEIAKQVTSMLPFSSAQAGELPRDKKVAPAAPAAPAQKPTYLSPLGIPETALSLLTGAVSPLTGTLYAGGRALAGKPVSGPEEAFGDVTFAPRSEAGRDLTSFVQKTLTEDLKVPPYIAGVGPVRPKPKAGRAVTQAEAAAAEAAAAADRARTAELPRLEGPKPAGTPSRAFDLRQRMAEAQERAAQAAEAAGDTEKAAALRAGVEQPRQFTPSPEAQQAGLEAVLARKRAGQAADVRKAQEAAAAAERTSTEAQLLAERERGIDNRAAALANVGERAAARRNIAAPAVIGAEAGVRAPLPEAGETIPPVSDIYPDFRGSVADEARRGPGATPFPTPVAEEKAPAPSGLEKGLKTFGLDNEDLLMLGLGMLASPGGQAGGELSQLFSNLGRSGMGAVAAKREREKLAQEKSYKDVMEKYYGKMAEMYGRPEQKERMLERLMREQNISYKDAIKLLAQLEYDPRAAAMFGVQGMKNEMSPMSMLQGGGGGMEGFSVVGKRPE